MNCPTCKSERSLVMETRRADESIWRRRCCRGCGRHYVTQELSAERMPPRERERVQDARKPSKFKTDRLAGIWK
jgi:transcriptional regulator NrdR family protein